MGNTQQLYGRLDMVMLDRQDKIYGSLGMHDSYLLNTVTGNPLTLTHSREGKMDDEVTDCKIYGWSKQFTTTGKNLINADEYYSQFKQSDETYKLKTTILNDIGISLSEFVGKEITLSVKLTVGANTSAVYLMYVNSEQKKINGSIIRSGLTGKSILTVTPVSNTDYFVITYGTGNDDVTFSELQLELGSVATSYEPNTGGNPSPSPEYPQEIVSAGSDGKINLEVHGKNLFDLEYAKSPKNWTLGSNEYYYIPYYVGKGNTVSVTYGTEIPEGLGAYIYINEYAGETHNVYTWLYHSTVSKLIINRVSFESVSDYIYLNVAGDYLNVIKKYMADLQIEVSPSPTAYEPYYTPQSISIQTPTGLPAIPVDSGGNYTDANGQQWVADYIDLKRGKYVQRVWQKTFDGSENMGIYDDVRGFSIRDVLPNKCYRRKGFMNQQKDFSIGLGNKYLYIYKSEFYDEGLADKGLSNWKAHLAEHPLTVMTYLDEPIERDITPSEIQAYQNLVTYAGTTIVENNAKCYMEVTYKASGNE